MTPQMKKYKEQLEKQLPIVCSDAIGAYIDTNMFIYPDAFPKLRSDTHIFLYSYYAIRNRAILAVKKLIEPSGKSKVNLDSIVKIITKPDCLYLPEKEKEYLTQWFNRVQTCESAMRLKKFRDAISHNLPDGDKAMIIYNDLMHTMTDVLELLARLHYDVFNDDKMSIARHDAKNIALVLEKDYWEAINYIARKAPKRNAELSRLNQLLHGKI